MTLFDYLSHLLHFYYNNNYAVTFNFKITFNVTYHEIIKFMYIFNKNESITLKIFNKYNYVNTKFNFNSLQETLEFLKKLNLNTTDYNVNITHYLTNHNIEITLLKSTI